MIKRLRTLKAPQLRLLLAVCSFVIFFTMAQTTPTGTDGCGSHDLGMVTVNNQHSSLISIKFSAKNSYTFLVESNSTFTSGGIRTGTYMYTANSRAGEKKSWNGSVEVKNAKTASVTIK